MPAIMEERSQGYRQYEDYGAYQDPYYDEEDMHYNYPEEPQHLY